MKTAEGGRGRARARWARAAAPLWGLALWVGVVGGAGCAKHGAVFGSNPADLPDNDDLAYHAIEDRFARAPQVKIKAHVTAQGALAASFDEKLVIDRPGSTTVDLDGTFKGQPLKVSFAARHGGALLNGKELGPDAAPRPGVDDSAIVGFMRTGLMYNASILAGGAPPTHSDGTARDFVLVGAFRHLGRTKVEGRQCRGFSFDVFVDGKLMGDATLWVSVDDALPVQRVQTIHLVDGDVKVVEKYASISVSDA